MAKKKDDKEWYRQVWVGIYANRYERKLGVLVPKERSWQDAKVNECSFEIVHGTRNRVIGFGLYVRADADENELDDVATKAEELVPSVQALFDEWQFPHKAEVCTAPNYQLVVGKLSKIEHESVDKLLIVIRMLNNLEKRQGHFPDTAEVLMEFTDRANRGEPVDKDILLEEYLLRIRKKLRNNLAMSEALIPSGEVYRKRAKASSADTSK